MTEIRNKVSESGIISLDLGKYKPTQEIIGIDLSEQLWQGLVLKEKDFRTWIKDNDWTLYENKAVFIFCSTDAILPTWAYMLVSIQLNGIAYCHVVGEKKDIEKILITENISKESLDAFQDGRVIIKGCSDLPAPDFAMVELTKHLQPVVKSLMFGEPCSTVPIYKKK
jgi:hypothetical protein